MKEFFLRIKSYKYTKKIIISALSGTIISFLLFYIFLPAINLRTVGFWIYLTAVILSYAFPFINFHATKKEDNSKNKTKNIIPYNISFNKWAVIPILTPIAIIIVGLIISSTVFNARKFASIIEVKEYNFSEDMKESEEITHIALMDTESAKKLGNRTLGSLSEVVSQFTVSEVYTQINYRNKPKKVTNLEYADVFKWFGNKATGIPGYVIVDPVESNATYQKLDSPMKYAESAYFGQDLERKLRFDYPTKIFKSISFEIDDNGIPYYIVSCAKPTVALFGAVDISEVIIFNPADGSSEICDIDNIPSWIDIVYTGELACEKYNWHGKLSGGFINSIIGNVDCKQATDDFGYIALENDIWYFTGVTSAVADDKSNIGFILTNARTGEYKFYPVIGAEEHSAMAAAEGQVQEKGYVASFPSLVNIYGKATYIMVLKDDAGLVKLYALVNVENYSIVTTGETQAEAMSSYKRLLRENGTNSSSNAETFTKDITVQDIRDVIISSNTFVYISDGENLYKASVGEDESILRIQIGDTVSLTYTSSEYEHIYVIKNWNFK